MHRYTLTKINIWTVSQKKKKKTNNENSLFIRVRIVRREGKAETPLSLSFDALLTLGNVFVFYTC